MSFPCALVGVFLMTSRTLRAALCPGIPLTAPPRSALDPQRNTFSHSVSTPHLPTCSFLVANGHVGASWKMFPLYMPNEFSISTGLLLSMHGLPSPATA